MRGNVIGRYELVEIIGEGGFGVVWRAKQRAPVRREVALKILKAGMDTRAVVARFEAERQTLAMMDHPHIARVFDGGETDHGRPYFVMELVHGVPINVFCQEAGMTVPRRIELFLGICDAVSHAHQKGIIHRDLKPTNILVARQGAETRPKVIDFGIARATEDPLIDGTMFTRSHQFLGTPAYMSPEQAGWGGLDIDTRSDIYSLGALLYELLTDRTPLERRKTGTTDISMIMQSIREQEPRRPSARLAAMSAEELEILADRRGETPAQLRRGLRDDLDWIVLKALEKDRERRYESVRDLAADLRRHLDGAPVEAAPPSITYQFRRFARRHRAALSTVAAFVFVLLVAAGVSSWMALRATRLAASEQRLRRQAETNESHLRHTVYSADMSLAAMALEREDEEAAREALRRHIPRNGETDIRGWEWRCLWNLAEGDFSRGLRGQTNGVTGLAINRAGDRIWSCAQDNTIREWDARTGTELRRWTTENQDWMALALHPSERRIVVVAPASNVAALLDLEVGSRRLVPLEADQVCWEVNASPNGLAYAHGRGGWGFVATNGLTVLRDENFGNPRVLPESGARSAFSPDGKLLATGAWLDRVKLWRWPDLQLLDEFGPVTKVGALCFSPDASILAVGGDRGELTLWNVKSGVLLRRLKTHHETMARSVQFSPDGRTLLTGGPDQRLGLWNWDGTDLIPIRTLRGYAGGGWRAIWSPNGREIVTGTRDDGVRIWPVDQTPFPLVEGLSEFSPIRFSPDNRYFAAALNNFTGVTVRLTVNGQEAARLEGSHRTHGFLPAGNTLLVQSNRTLRFLEVPSLRLEKAVELAPPPAGVTVGMRAELSPDGRCIAWTCVTGEIVVWDVNNGGIRRHYTAHAGGAGRLAFTADGRHLVSGGSVEAELRLWDAGTFERMRAFPAPAVPPWEIAFSRDGGHLLVNWLNGNSTVLDSESGLTEAAFSPGLGAGVFSEDGGTVITATRERLRFFNLRGQREAGAIPIGAVAGQFLTLSPDGTMIATVAEDHTLRWWRAPQLQSTHGDSFAPPRPKNPPPARNRVTSEK